MIEQEKLRREVISDVEKALNNGELEELQAGLKRAKQLNIEEEGSLFDEARDFIERAKKEQELINALSDALEKGAWLNKDDNCEYGHLESVIQNAEEFEMKTQAGQKLLLHVTFIEQLRKTVKLAIESNPQVQENWDLVQEAIAEACDADAALGEHPEVTQATNGLNAFIEGNKQEEKLKKQIEDAVQKQDLTSLGNSLTMAKKLNMTCIDYPIISAAEVMYEELNTCLTNIKKCCTSGDETEIRQPISYAKKLNYKKPIVKTAFNRLKALVSVRYRAEKLLKIIEPDQMKACVQEADQLSATIPEVEKLRYLLYKCPVEKFLQLQLKAAMALMDPDRIMIVTLNLKEQFFAMYKES
eukprot:UN25267